MHRFFCWLAALAMAGTVGLVGGSPARAGEPVVISEGAVVLFDASVGADGAPVLAATHDGMSLPPDQIRVEVDGDVALTQPDQVRDEYDGVLEPEAEVFHVPGSLTPGLPTIGWSAEAIAADGGGSPTLTMSVEIDGPGDVVVLGRADDGAIVTYVDTGDAVADELLLTPGDTEWPAWLFDQPGSYLVTARPVLHRADGTTQAGAPATYQVEVTAPTEPETPDPTDPTDPTEPTEPPETPDPILPPAPTEPTPPPTPPTPADATPQAADCDVPGLADGAITVAEGHFDYGVQVSGRTLRSRIKDDRSDPAVWRRPAAVLFALGAEAAHEVPSGSTYGFLGEPGDQVWTIGQTQEPGVPWLGWNTQHPSALDRITGATTWRLDAVDGPGELFVYQTGSLGALEPVLSLAGGWPHRTRIPANTHAHGNWSFTEPGVYRVTTTHQARLDSGATVSSRATLYFQVGDCEGSEAPTGDLPADTLLADADLTRGNRGPVVVEPTVVASGDAVTVEVGGSAPGSWLMPTLYSAPRQLGWSQVTATGDLALTIPRSASPGRHKLAVYDADGLVGWAPLRIRDDAAPPAEEPNDIDHDPPPSDDPGEAPADDPASTTPAPPASSPQSCTGTDGSGDVTTDSPGGGDGTSDGTQDDPAGSQSTVGDGHFDFGPEIVGDDLVARVKDDRTQPPSWVAPESLLFLLGDAAAQRVPSGGEYSFLGSPGDRVWLIPQTQVAGVPWLGWNTQHETVRSAVRGSVRFTLEGVSGPGELAVYLTDSFGGIGSKVFGSATGFPRSFDVPVNVHAHGNWAFTAPGRYEVRMTVSTTLAGGRTVSDDATLSFSVGVSGRVRPSRAEVDRRPSVVVPALNILEPITDQATQDEDAGEESEEDATDGECVIPDTGASAAVTQLLPLAVTLIAVGAGLVVQRRRARPRAVRA